QKYETTVDAVYRLYSSFRGESNGLQELRSVLDLCEIDLGSPKAIHWTSIFPAVEAIDSSWPTLVLLLERLYYKGVELANCSKLHLKHFERLKESYLESVRGNLLDRFPSSVLEAISSFSAIFNPKCYPQSLEDIGSYGVSELNFLLQAYSRVVVSERALSDFPLFKRIVFSLSQLSFKDLCVKLVYSSSEMHELFPDFAVLAAIALALPLGS
ncbi:PREDICTED: uncharacterized protein LOC104406021, partial [Nestor notabilis]|uniref:uncharacterized protein LOC104406021 n=1 Tax=Nestor notabilis TaxID=176057 RepID=UPI000523732F